MGYSVQGCFWTFSEKWKKTVDNGKVFPVVLADISEAFEWLGQSFVTINLNVCRNGIKAFKSITY